jgi:hypothetical protein
VSGLIVGIYVFRLTVTDNRGGTKFDDVKITVQTALPIASQSIRLNESSGKFRAYTDAFHNLILENIGTISRTTVFKIYDLSGAILKQGPINSNRISLDGISTGIYIVEVIQNDHRLRQRIIIR